MKKSKLPKVVILGAGFAGVRTALDLAKQKILDITLVNKTPYHQYHADLYEVAATSIPEPQKKLIPKISFENLRGSVTIPLDDIFSKTNVGVIVGEAVSINLKEQKVGLKNRKLLRYDVLVLALGSETNYFGIPNLEKFSLPLKDVDDALNIRNEIDEIFAHKKEKDKIHIIIGGGGFTGCELAGELVGYLKNLSKIHTHKQHDIKLSIVEACPVLINGSVPSVQSIAEKRLKKLGVHLYLNSKITHVSKKIVYAAPHLALPYDLLIWTAGVRSNSLVDKLVGVHTEKTCLIVDKTLRLISFKTYLRWGILLIVSTKKKVAQYQQLPKRQSIKPSTLPKI